VRPDSAAGLPVRRFDQWLMDELNLNGFQHQGALMCGEVLQLPLDGSGELDLIGHSSSLPSTIGPSAARRRRRERRNGRRPKRLM
jgi:hypothetical protein